ncbi:MAG: peptidoglycan DD-metalloendopeptidase family protein, partial [Anaerolineae bacterium]|nr:peptidoglycan DD-metalloendopeptidase family protein [Anaerolineae bacterium]
MLNKNEQEPFSLDLDSLLPPENPIDAVEKPQESLPLSTPFERFWEQLAQADLMEPAIKMGSFVLFLVLVVAVVWIMRSFYLETDLTSSAKNAQAVLAAPLPTATPSGEISGLPSLTLSSNSLTHGISRQKSLHTSIPSRSRVDVITYNVELGDSVFGIADKFGIKPETILWANTGTLQDNPHSLQPDQELNIMPVDGIYHKWSAGEDITKVAQYYGVEVLDIVQWPGNKFNLFDIDLENLVIEAGTMLIIPHGQREMIDYGPPRIPRDNPAVARTYGPGHCGTISTGVVGDGIFLWPTTEHWLSGYDYNPAANHAAIDISGDTGNPIWNIDDGVVVYAGWSYNGYGNLVVVDHGNGWQSLYGHVDAIYVTCGMSLFQGATIGTVGNTGNSSGSHLHFELMYGTVKVNP